MKKIACNVNDESVDLFIKIVSKLSDARAKGRNVKIRIGGDEYGFLSAIDGAQDLTIDDVLFYSLSPSEQRDFEITRVNAINALNAPIQVAQVNVATPVTPVAPVNSDSDGTSIAPSTMLSNDDIGSIRSIVNGKVMRGEMFTAFDITKELRANGKQVKHYEVKDVVHGMFMDGDMDDYHRNLGNVGNPPAFIYHPQGEDVNNYATN